MRHTARLVETGEVINGLKVMRVETKAERLERLETERQLRQLTKPEIKFLLSE